MAQVAYANEWFELISDECIWLSVDDKIKPMFEYWLCHDTSRLTDSSLWMTNLTTTIMTFRILIAKWLHQATSSWTPSPEEDTISAPPVSYFLSLPLSHRSRSLFPPHHDLHGCATISTDQFGWQHLNYGQTGNMYVVNQPTNFMKTLPQTHANDMHRILW